MRGARALVGAAVLTAALAGCAAPAPSIEEPGGTAPPAAVQPGSLRPLMPATHPDITPFCPEVDATPLGELGLADPVAEVDAIYRCGVDFSTPGDGTAGDGAIVGTQYAERLATGSETLLTAYSIPSSSEPAEACRLMLADPLILWIEVAGEIYAVHAPVDSCGFPASDAADPYVDAAFERFLTVDAGS